MNKILTCQSGGYRREHIRYDNSNKLDSTNYMKGWSFTFFK